MDTTKLEKILNLMDNAGTTGEAEAAAAAFQRLLLKANLTEADVRAKAGEQKVGRIEIRNVSVGRKRERGVTWKHALLAVLTKYNFCDYVRAGAHGGDGYIVGETKNIDYVLTMYFQMVTTFERMSQATWLEQTPSYRNAYNRVAFTNSFLMGVPVGLRKKFQEERRGEDFAGAEVNALMVLTDQALAQAIADRWGKLSSGGSNTISHGDAYRKGVAAGQSYSNPTPLAGGRKALKG